MAFRQMILPPFVKNGVKSVEVPRDRILDEWELSFERSEDRILFDEFYHNPSQTSATFSGACTIAGRPTSEADSTRHVSYFLFAATIWRSTSEDQTNAPFLVKDGELRNHDFYIYPDAFASYMFKQPPDDIRQERFSVGWFEPLLPATI